MITLLCGNEPYLIKNELNKIKKEYGELAVCEYEQLSQDAIDACGQTSLFAARRAVIVHLSGLPDSTELMSYMKRPSSVVDLYLVAPELDKRSAIYKAFQKEVRGRQTKVLDKVTRDKFKMLCISLINRMGYSVRESALQLLYERSGYAECEDCSLFDISIYIKQMCYQADDKEITTELVEQIVMSYSDAVIWSLFNAMFTGDQAELMYLGERLLRMENPLSMLAGLQRQIRLAYKAKLLGGNEQSLTKKLGVPMRYLRSALRYDEMCLSNALGIIQRRVNDMKSGICSADVFRLALCEVKLLLNSN